MYSVILMIFLGGGAGVHAGKGDSSSGWVFFGIGFLILILAFIRYQNNLKKEEQKRLEREKRKKSL